MLLFHSLCYYFSHSIYFIFRKDWMRILTLKTFAVTIFLHYNNDHTLSAIKRLKTVRFENKHVYNITLFTLCVILVFNRPRL